MFEFQMADIMAAVPEIFLAGVGLVLVLVAAYGGEGARNARRVTRDKNIATVRQHQRLVPAGCGVMEGRIDPGRAAGVAAMTA